MHSLAHILIGVKALEIETPNFIFACAAPDMPTFLPNKNNGLTYYETHNAKASTKLKNKDLALGFAAHYAVDAICHNRGAYDKGFSYYMHNVPEYLYELWIAKTNPEIFDLAAKMYFINVDEVALDIAEAFQKDVNSTKLLVNKWHTLVKTINTTTKILKNLVPKADNRFTNRLDDNIGEYITYCAHKVEK